MRTLAILLALLVAGPAHAGITGWSNANYLNREEAVVTAYPFAFYCWGYLPKGAASIGTALTIGNSASAVERRAQARIDATEHVQAAVETSAGFSVASVSAAASEETWFLLSTHFVSITLREAQLNDGDLATNATSRDPTGADRTRIGRRHTNLEPWSSTGALAECSIWDTTGMDATNRRSLDTKMAAGENPININAESAQPWSGLLVAYWPLNNVSDFTDYSGNGYDMTQAGTLSNFASHPTIDPVTSGDTGIGVTRRRGW